MAKLKTNEEIQAEREAELRTKQTRYDTTLLALAYCRQSTKEQPIKNKEAASMQTDDLISYAIDTYKWPRERIMLFIENELDRWGNKLEKPRAASGALDINLRPGLKEIENLICAGKVGAIFVRDISRLFRDEDMIDPPQFAKVCKENNVVIVTYDQEFDFNATARNDLEDFLEEAQAAAGYLKTLRRTMHRARDRKGKRGDYAGHAIPTGFMLDERRRDYVPNPHWSEQVAYLTRRYRQLDGDLPALRREILGKPIFEDLPEDIRERVGKIYLEKVEGGYTIKSRFGLIWMLTNPANIGHKTYKGRIVKPNAHPAIVDKDDFMFALKRLGEVDLEGNQIERPQRAVRYTQRLTEQREGLLSGVRADGRPVLTSSQGSVYVFQQADCRDATYTIKNGREMSLYQFIGSISVGIIDKIFTDRLLRRLNAFSTIASGKEIPLEWVDVEGQEPPSERAREMLGQIVLEKTRTQAAALYNRFATIRQEIAQNLVSVDTTIKNINEEITRKQRRLNVAEDIMSDEEIREIYDSLRRLRLRLATLEQKKKEASQIVQDINTVGGKITKVRQEWAEMTLEERRSFVRLITQSITLDEVTDSWITLTIKWSPVLSFETNERAYILRFNGAGTEWINEEDDILRNYYQEGTRTELLALLPLRSWRAIISRASHLKVQRNTRRREEVGIPENVSLEDYHFIQEHNLDMSDPKRRVWWEKVSTINEDSKESHLATIQTRK